MVSPYNIGVVHKGFTVKLGPVVPSVVIKSAQNLAVASIFRRILKTNQYVHKKSGKHLNMNTAVGAMHPAKMFTMMRNANL